MRGSIAQLHMMADFFLIEGFLVHIEVEQGNGVDMVEFEIPFITLGSLLTDREGGIEQGTVLEVCLVCILHFHDKLLSVFSFTIYVEDGLAVGIYISHVLRVQILHVLNNLSSVEQAVEETDQQILVGS